MLISLRATAATAATTATVAIIATITTATAAAAAAVTISATATTTIATTAITTTAMRHKIIFASSNARMELAAPGDDEANKAAEAANRRLLALFKKGWTRGDKLLFDCYREYKKRLCYHHQAEG